MFNATYCIEHISYAKFKDKELKTNMFRKLVSSLPFSPALVGQLGFYARRLKKEQATRRLGLVFTALALIMQSFAVFNPPDQALASSASDIVPGGVSSVKDILSVYDSGAQGKNDFKDLMEYFGVTRDELANMRLEKTCSKDHSIISFGRQHLFSSSEGELTHRVPSRQGASTFYSAPLFLHDRFNGGAFCTDSFVGNSAKVGWFSIMKKCGNFQIKQDVRRLPKASFINATCKTIQGFAYDERQPSQTVKVHIFIGGPPGKGTAYGPITANQPSPDSPAGTGHGFSFSVPESYQTSPTPTEVWGVMQPLAGWTEANVQMANSVTIPGNCIPQAKPIAECSSLTINKIDRTKLKLSAAARAENGAKIEGYRYSITDASGKVVYDKTHSSNQASDTSEQITLAEGAYKAQSTIKTSIGDIEGANCNQPITIAAINKCPYNPNLLATDKDCQPCPYNSTLWIKSEDCAPSIAQSKEARNLTQNNKDANNTTVKSGDRIEYTLYTTNLGNSTITTAIDESLGDVLEYASLFENGGGNFNNISKVLRWENVSLKPGQTDVRRIIVTVAEKIVTTPRAGNNPSSYNCVMTNAYGNTVNIMVDCPPNKVVETTVQQLPSTGAGENIIFGSILLMVVTYFYARSRQMNKEVRLLKREFDGGTV